MVDWQKWHEDRKRQALEAKAIRDALDISKVRELKRDWRNKLILHGKIVDVFPCRPPTYLDMGDPNSPWFENKEDAIRGLYVTLESVCEKLGADCYELGKKPITTWTSDPGFGSRADYYLVQFYRLLTS